MFISTMLKKLEIFWRTSKATKIILIMIFIIFINTVYSGIQMMSKDLATYNKGAISMFSLGLNRIFGEPIEKVSTKIAGLFLGRQFLTTKEMEENLKRITELDRIIDDSDYQLQIIRSRRKEIDARRRVLEAEIREIEDRQKRH